MPNKKLALFDIDGTVLPMGAGIFQLVDYLTSVNLLDFEFAQKMHQIHKDYKEHKSITYEEHATLEFQNFAKGLKGKPYEMVRKEAQSFLKENIVGQIYDYAKGLINKLSETYDIFLVTANSQFYAEFFKDYLEASGYESTILEIDDQGFFTGEITEFLSKAEEKEKVVKKLLTKYHKEDSIAFGDAEGDRIMLELAEIAICINPTEGMRKIAEEKGWEITDERNIEKIVLTKLGDKLG